MAIVLGTLVFACVASEFIRGGRVLREKLNTNLAGAMYHLTRRNMRRYGGYIAHLGLAVVVIGLARPSFNPGKEKEMGPGDRLRRGRYQLHGRRYTPDHHSHFRPEPAQLSRLQTRQRLPHK